MSIGTPGLSELFHPYQDLALDLLPYAVSDDHDAAHGVDHLVRVWTNACRIAAVEGGDLKIVAAAVMLHDCVAVSKSSPLRGSASRMSGTRARGLLSGMGWDAGQVAAVVHAIEAHSFSSGIEPLTIEAKIVQDADRLDALGAVGIARCFALAGARGQALYDPRDPAAAVRPIDDAVWALDHLPAKLMRLAASFQTREGAKLAAVRHERLLGFQQHFFAEIGIGDDA